MRLPAFETARFLARCRHMCRFHFRYNCRDSSLCIFNLIAMLYDSEIIGRCAGSCSAPLQRGCGGHTKVCHTMTSFTKSRDGSQQSADCGTSFEITLASDLETVASHNRGVVSERVCKRLRDDAHLPKTQPRLQCPQPRKKCSSKQPQALRHRATVHRKQMRRRRL
jgi:hypothetical protein